MESIIIKSRHRDYEVFFKEDLNFFEELKKRDAIWVIDENVHELYAEHFSGIGRLALLSADEKNKNIDAAIRLGRTLADYSCRRNTELISVGGGITQDITGFTASIFHRGLNWTYVPTTLLAQADSCIGAKTSLNLENSKNILGTFYAPKEVYISAKFLETLSPIERASGFGEIIKLLITKTRTPEELNALADRLERDSLPKLVYDTLLIKKDYIEEDEFDVGQRRLLNYGHCFGHALEAVSGFAIPHGLAVVAGMIVATEVARMRKWIDQGFADISTRRILWPAFHAELIPPFKKHTDDAG
jgi:3-dehydroquinate synthase